MPRTLALAALACLFTFPACVTEGAYDALAKPEVVSERTRGPAGAIDAVNGAAVAWVEDRLTVFVAAATADGHARFFAASLQGADEDAPRTFAPAAITVLPPSVMPVVFTTSSSDGLTGHPAGWWHDVKRSDLEHAALISVVHDANAWRLWVSVPDANGRRVAATRDGLLPEVDDQDAAPIVLDSPPAWVVHEKTELRALGSLAFIGLLPATVALDAAGAATVITLMIPFLPFLWLFSPHGC